MARVLSKALKSAMGDAADRFDLPVEFLVAWSLATGGWEPDGRRYDPNHDRVRVAGKPEVWASHPEWLIEGPTCEEFFLFHPEREPEWIDGREYDFVAQTDLASSYGPFLLPYAEALRHGFTGAPADLASVDEGTHWAAVCLLAEAESAKSVGRHGDDALVFALMAVGSWIPSRRRVAEFEEAHREVYGTGFFGG
jgi:hypothetical protein